GRPDPEAVPAPRSARRPGGEVRRVRRVDDAAGISRRRGQGAHDGPRLGGDLRRQPPRQGDGDRTRRGRLRQRHAVQRPGQDRAGQGPVHPVLRRHHGRHRRRPHRLLPGRRARPARAQRRERRRGRTPPAGRGAGRRLGRRPPRRLRRAGRPGRALRRGAATGRAAHRPRLHVLRGGTVRRSRRRRVPHRLHRRARLRADRRRRRRTRVVGRAARGRRGVRDAPLRPRLARHAAHRDGLPAPWPGHHHRRQPGRGRAELGGGLEEGRVLGSRRDHGGQGGRPEAPTAWTHRDRARHPPTRHGCHAHAARPAVRHHVRHLLPDPQEGHRSGVGSHDGPSRGSGRRRHPRTPRDLPAHQTTVRRDVGEGVL
ncbi:MAG: Aminomethyltransferase (glycine cleavage system T protein), partial [uncultured Nocardioides sp.]